MMNSVLHLVLANVMVAGLLAVVAWLVGRHSRRPALVHTLWLLVLVKLVTPPIIKLPVQWPSTNRAPETTTQKELPTPPRKLQSPDRVVLLALEPEPPQMLLAPAGASGSSMTFSFALRVATEVHTELATEATEERRQELPAEPRAESSLWPRLLLALWAAGSAGWLLCTVASLLAFCRLLRQALPAPPAIQAQADALARHMGLASAPPVLLIPGPMPPMLWGVGAARLLFPAGLLGRLDEEGRASLLAHELAHLRRRDHWVRLFELIVVALCWWCPLLWLARKQLHVAEEACCDAWVVSEIAPRVYAGAILETLDFLADEPIVLPLGVSGLGQVEGLKRRLVAIMERQTPPCTSPLGWLLVLLLSPVLPVLPTAARDAGPRKISSPVAANSKPEENPSSPHPGTYALVPLPGGGFQATPIEIAFDAREVIEADPIVMWQISSPWILLPGNLSPVPSAGGAVSVPRKTNPSGATSSSILAN